MIPKYIHYSGLVKYGTNGKTRSYFVVEKHPTLIANDKKHYTVIQVREGVARREASTSN